MPEVLLAAHPGRGHLNPMLALAGRLRSAGWTPVFAGYGPMQTLDFECEDLGIPYPADWHAFHSRLSGTLETAFALEMFCARPLIFTRAVGAILRRRPVAAVLSDFSFPGAQLAAESARLPWLSVYHAGVPYPGPGIPPFGSGLPIGAPLGMAWLLRGLAGVLSLTRALARLAWARHILGLPLRRPRPDFWHSPWGTLVLTAEQVEAPRYPLPENTFMVGPCSFDCGGRLDLPPTTRPRVFVSLGTVFANRPRLYRRIITALSGRCQLLVSAGAAYPRLLDLQGPDVLLFRQVPQRAVLRQVDAVVSHGGNNTVTEALAEGLPQLVLPVGGEQGDDASRLVYLGAGMRGELNNLDQQLDRLLAEPGFRQAAGRAAKSLGEMDGPGTVLRFLDRVLETGTGIERRPGRSATVPRQGPMPWED